MVADSGSLEDETCPDRLYKFMLPMYNDKACLWISERFPHLRCNETFSSALEMFDHVVNEHVLNACVSSVFSSSFSAKVYICMWFERSISHYCRWRITDLDRYEGAALRDSIGHVRGHVNEVFEEEPGLARSS